MTEQDFLTAFNISPPEETAAVETETETVDTVSEEPATADVSQEAEQEQTETNSEPEQTETATQVETPQSSINSKANHAFAEMRANNAKYKAALEKVAEVLKVPNTGNFDDLLSVIETKALEAQSAQSNVPVELLQQMSTMQKQLAAREQSDRKASVLVQLENVKRTFELDDAQLTDFVSGLVKQGKNPYATKLDFVSEYKLANFDRLIKEASEKATQAEIARAAKASQSSTTPTSTRARTSDTNKGKSNSVAALGEFMSTL